MPPSDSPSPFRSIWQWRASSPRSPGPEKARTLYDTVRGSARTETFPVAMVRTSESVFGLVADSPGLWENRCQVLLDPPARRLAVLTGDGRDPYPLVIKPPEDARDTYQYQMDGWQSLAAGETRRFTTWVFASPARTHYDAQVAAHLAVANGKGWNSSALEAILRNTSLFLLRRNLALDANNQPRDGRYIFISGPGYGWKQWVSDGFYTALGLDDPEKTIESNRAVFWTRMDYEDNAQYYLIWAVLMKRAGGTVNEALVRKAYEFLRRHEKDGFYIPPPLPGAPNAKGWKTYHDVLPYDDDDSPASNQGFHCGALLAAKELGLGVTDAGYRARDCGLSLAVQHRARLHAHEPQAARHPRPGHALRRDAHLRGVREETAHRRASADALSHLREGEDALRPARHFASRRLAAARPQRRVLLRRLLVPERRGELPAGRRPRPARRRSGCAA